MNEPRWYVVRYRVGVMRDEPSGERVSDVCAYDAREALQRIELWLQREGWRTVDGVTDFELFDIAPRGAA